MKKLLLATIVIVAAFAFVGCKQKAKEATMRESFEKALVKAEHSQQTETELFLGFRLGMSEEKVMLFLDSLERSGKVFVDDEGAYKYNFKLSSDHEIRIGFCPVFENDSLYAITYTLNSEYSSGNEMGMMMISFNQSERGKTFRGYYVDDVLGETSFHYIKDNLMVTFRKNGICSYMDYEDIPISSRVKREKENKDEEARKQSNKEF